MKQPNSEEVRNHQDTENDSQEQRDKVKKHQDVEPQAENGIPGIFPIQTIKINLNPNRAIRKAAWTLPCGLLI